MLPLTRRSFSALALAFGWFGRARSVIPPSFEVFLESNQRVALRDGVHLATDVYRPARGGQAVTGRFPVILERTPYGRNVTYFRDITAANSTPKTRAEVAAIASGWMSPRATFLILMSIRTLARPRALASCVAWRAIRFTWMQYGRRMWCCL